MAIWQAMKKKSTMMRKQRTKVRRRPNNSGPHNRSDSQADQLKKHSLNTFEFEHSKTQNNWMKFNEWTKRVKMKVN